MHSFPKLFLFSASFPSLCERRAGASAQRGHFWGLPSLGLQVPAQSREGMGEQAGQALQRAVLGRAFSSQRMATGKGGTWRGIYIGMVVFSAGLSHAHVPDGKSAFCRDPAAFLGSGIKQCWIAADPVLFPCGSPCAGIQGPLTWQ